MNAPGHPIQATVGHLLDLYRIALFKLVAPHSYTKYRQIKNIAKRAGCHVFIETGTYRGVTARRCSRVFRRVYTIELDQALASQARNYLATHQNVEVICSDGLVALPQVLSQSNVDDVMIFLDGHFSGGITARGNVAEPAVLEISALAIFREKIRAIIIDDFRCFGVDDGWPSKSSLLRSIEESFPGWFIQINLDQVIVTKPRSFERAE